MFPTHPHIWQFARFAIVGVTATALHWGVYLLLQRYINVNVAYTLGYALSFVANFYLSAYFTFHSRPSWRKAAGFAGAHITNYVLHILLLNFFLWAGVPQTWAPAPVFGVAVPVNFLLVRHVFRHGNNKKDGVPKQENTIRIYRK